MKQYPMENIRNICLVSGGHAGKTTLGEVCLHMAGASDRWGKVADGNTVSDFDPEEIKRTISISTALLPFEWNGCKINMLDTPGYFDFAGEAMEGIRVADAALIPVSGKSGVSVGTEKAWNYAQERGIPSIIFINKMDDENSGYTKVVEQLRECFGTAVMPFVAPIKVDGKLTGFVDLVHKKAKNGTGIELTDCDMPDWLEDGIEKFIDMIKETIAVTEDSLMEKYFAGEDFTQEEIVKAVKSGVRSGAIVPVFCGSALTGGGVSLMLDAIVKYMPMPADTVEGVVPGKDEIVELSANDSLSALVFKTVADPYVGKMSYFRVFSGSIKADSQVLNASTGETEKIGKLYVVRGKKQIEVSEITAGDIGAVAKLAKTKTGHTLCAPGKAIALEGIKFPTPAMSLAVKTLEKGDEEKIGSGLHKLLDEDPTLQLQNNTETKQMLLSGLGEQHLEVTVSKLKAKFGVSVELIEPKVAYRETIRKKVKVEGKHKKQSGGHGQFGHVWIEFEPGEKPELEFAEQIFGGAVPKNYFPAVEKGLQECIAHGVLAGYPVVNLKATLVDGSYHPVDSSEMAFKVAASLAYKKGLEEAGPVLLEPVGHLEVHVPDSYMGDIIGDVNKRRGRVLGMNPGELIAEVPMGEMTKYATDLRSITQGRGDFTFTFERYEEAPSNIAQKIIEEAQKNKED
ncbi:MAG: elongation factor G [Ruminococcaceae bacterium]|nr:elongation factor G [Oscillospiraceae bacterium]